ncbi:hypothetical protein [Listeria fleischmannii]|nr:hypothetical protein [Listeria fleischmannii]
MPERRALRRVDKEEYEEIIQRVYAEQVIGLKEYIQKIIKEELEGDEQE